MEESTVNYFKNLFSGTNISSLSLPSIRITDIIDILVVAILIYVLIHWIKETRAWTLFKGILIILVINFLGEFLHFYTLTWIIEKTLSVGVIAVIIIFQPELRRALEQLGTGGLSSVAGILQQNTSEGKLTRESIDEIYDACIKMSAARTGALIAIERNVPTGDLFKSSGVPIDGIISSQLIVNIFEDKTPLHDGAIVIRNNRIAAASCILPVTESEIDQELGTRHRAAVGGSEISDAYFIVVSEETGRISLAKRGTIQTGLTPNEFMTALNRLIEPNKTSAININKIWKGMNRHE